MHHTRNRVRRILVALAGAALLLSGCSQGEESTSRAASAVAADLSEVQAAVDESKATPADITVTEALGQKPEPGKRFIWFSCDIPSCSIMGEALERAVAAVGWEYREISYKSADPATLVAAMRQALRYEPDYVALTGVPQEAGWGAVIGDYEAAGVKIIASYLGDTETTDTVIANVAGPGLSVDAGETLADWFIADSDGAGHALLQRVDDFPSLRIFADAFAERVEEGCPDCTITDLNNTIDEAGSGGVVPAVVSSLRSVSDMGYVVSSHAGFINGLGPALKAAGLEGKVKIAAENADAVTLTAIQSGEADAATGNPLHYASWLIVDVALRHLQGMEFPAEGFAMPMQLLTADVDFEVSNSHDVPADYEDRFAALWGVE